MAEPPLAPMGRRPQDKITLASMILGMIVVAVFAASARETEHRPNENILCGVASAGLVLGLVVATVFLIRRRASWPNIVLGLLLGAVFGPLSMLLLVLPGSLAATTAGALIVAGYAAVVHKLSGRPGR